jgi:hypothetical protein
MDFETIWAFTKHASFRSTTLGVWSLGAAAHCLLAKPRSEHKYDGHDSMMILHYMITWCTMYMTCMILYDSNWCTPVFSLLSAKICVPNLLAPGPNCMSSCQALKQIGQVHRKEGKHHRCSKVFQEYMKDRGLNPEDPNQPKSTQIIPNHPKSIIFFKVPKVHPNESPDRKTCLLIGQASTFSKDVSRPLVFSRSGVLPSERCLSLRTAPEHPVRCQLHAQSGRFKVLVHRNDGELLMLCLSCKSDIYCLWPP